MFNNVKSDPIGAPFRQLCDVPLGYTLLWRKHRIWLLERLRLFERSTSLEPAAVHGARTLTRPNKLGLSIESRG